MNIPKLSWLILATYVKSLLETTNNTYQKVEMLGPFSLERE